MNVIRQLLLILFLLCLQNQPLFAQRVTPLFDDISIDSILQPQMWASKIAYDPIAEHLFYTTSSGNIYEVLEESKTDVLRYTTADHGIAKVQGLCFVDSTVFLSGNIWYTNTGIGLVVKGELQPNGTRNWTTVLTTAAYPTSSASGDHGFTGITVDPQKEFLYFSGGSRTSFGEVETNNGAYPGMREQALTSKIYRIPLTASNIYLNNDSIALQNCGYVYAEGTRNAYSMAFNGANQLFAIDNAGERDDPEELNLIEQGKHYGFPWRIGGNANPLINPSYDASSDPLINPNNAAFLAGYFAPDPSFPIAPAGINFTEPLPNYGLAADYYKEEGTGSIQKASESGQPLRTFTAHRSPLGLVIDKDKQLGGKYTGNGFVLSFMPGGDSTGYTPLSPWGSACPFVDTSRELVMLRFAYDSTLYAYGIHTTNVATGFYLPVDATQVGNSIYVLENNGVIWKVSFPPFVNAPACLDAGVFIYPNPAGSTFQVYYPNPNNKKRHLEISNLEGKMIASSEDFKGNSLLFKRAEIASGTYYVSLIEKDAVIAKQKVILL
jgi:hypothetical protein